MTSHSIFVTRCPRFRRFAEKVEHEVIKVLLEVIKLAYAGEHSKLTWKKTSERYGNDGVRPRSKGCLLRTESRKSPQRFWKTGEQVELAVKHAVIFEEERPVSVATGKSPVIFAIFDYLTACGRFCWRISISFNGYRFITENNCIIYR